MKPIQLKRAGETKFQRMAANAKAKQAFQKLVQLKGRAKEAR